MYVYKELTNYLLHKICKQKEHIGSNFFTILNLKNIVIFSILKDLKFTKS